MEKNPSIPSSVINVTKRRAATNASLNIAKKQASNLKRVSSLLRKKKNCRPLSEEEEKFLLSNSELVKQFYKRREKRAEWLLRQNELEDSPLELEEKCFKLAQAIHDAEFLVVYTGAGISTAASIPDYRGPNGIWTRLQKGKDIGNHDLTTAEPTYTHMALAHLHSKGIVRHVVSQNCDGLHLRSGLPKTSISEVHGNMYIEVCKHCVPSREYVRTFDVTEKTSTFKHTSGRRCYRCGEPLVDTIVHFGERGRLRWPLNWQGACQAAKACDTILCLGSSLKVLRKYTWLWQMNRPPKRRPRLYVVNLQWTPKDKDATLKINGKCDDVMELIMKNLGFQVAPYCKVEDPIFSISTPLHIDELGTITRPPIEPPASSTPQYSNVDSKFNSLAKVLVNHLNYKNGILKNFTSASLRKNCILSAISKMECLKGEYCKEDFDKLIGVKKEEASEVANFEEKEVKPVIGEIKSEIKGIGNEDIKSEDIKEESCSHPEDKVFSDVKGDLFTGLKVENKEICQNLNNLKQETVSAVSDVKNENNVDVKDDSLFNTKAGEIGPFKKDLIILMDEKDESLPSIKDEILPNGEEEESESLLSDRKNKTIRNNIKDKMVPHDSKVEIHSNAENKMDMNEVYNGRKNCISYYLKGEVSSNLMDGILASDVEDETFSDDDKEVKKEDIDNFESLNKLCKSSKGDDKSGKNLELSCQINKGEHTHGGQKYKSFSSPNNGISHSADGGLSPVLSLSSLKSVPDSGNICNINELNFYGTGLCIRSTSCPIDQISNEEDDYDNISLSSVNSDHKFEIPSEEKISNGLTSMEYFTSSSDDSSDLKLSKERSSGSIEKENMDSSSTAVKLSDCVNNIVHCNVHDNDSVKGALSYSYPHDDASGFGGEISVIECSPGDQPETIFSSEVLNSSDINVEVPLNVLFSDAKYIKCKLDGSYLLHTKVIDGVIHAADVQAFNDYSTDEKPSNGILSIGHKTPSYDSQSDLKSLYDGLSPKRVKRGRRKAKRRPLELDDDVKRLWFWGCDTQLKEKIPQRRLTRGSYQKVLSNPESASPGYGCNCLVANPTLCRLAATRHSHQPLEEEMVKAREAVYNKRQYNYRKFEPIFEVSLKSLTYKRRKIRRSRKRGIERESNGDEEEKDKNSDGGDEGGNKNGETKIVPGWYGKGYRKLLKKKKANNT